ncbi:MAG: glycosyltransferase family 39 protein [Deltaproteobacteria bacterium]|nr:glycosyltransferase family 39 protein [Deltaproteobacteria bacterium]
MVQPQPRAPRAATAGGVLARPAVQVAILMALAAVFYLARAAKEPLDGDPAMYATIARTIVRTGEWTHLTFNGDPYLNKPPLHFWLNALVFRGLGASTFTATLVPGLLGVVDVVLLYVACRVMFPGRQTAFAAALVYVTTPEVVHWSRGVHLETLVTFWVLLGVLAAFWSVRQHPAATALVGVAAGGGWLAKGPQGLFPVALALLLWLREGVARRRIRSWWALAGVIIALAAAVPWLWARVSEGTGFAGAYFGGQIGNVLFGRRVLGRGPLWYLVKLGRTYWPWLPVAAAGLVILGRRWRSSLGARAWLLYTALVLVVITFAAGKKSRYLFQLYPALAVAAGTALAAAAERVPRLLTWLVGAAVAAALAVGIVGDHVSRAQALHSREALEVARLLDGDDVVLITRETQWGEPQFGKILGFYARPLLHACHAACDEEAAPGRALVARTDELDALLGRLKSAGLIAADAASAATAADAVVVARTASLALVRVPRPAAR